MKKFLAVSLTLILCCMINFMGGCATTDDKIGKLTVSATLAIEIKQNADRNEALKNLTFTYTPENGEKTSVWNETTQEWEQKEMVASEYVNLTYEKALKLGLLVTGYKVDTKTEENKTRKLTFTLFGAKCTLEYKVVESA